MRVNTQNDSNKQKYESWKINMGLHHFFPQFPCIMCITTYNKRTQFFFWVQKDHYKNGQQYYCMTVLLLLQNDSKKSLMIQTCTWHYTTYLLTSLSVPTSSTMGRHWLGGTPPMAVYRDSFPTGIPMPFAPRSPRPKIRSPSVTTTACNQKKKQN